VENLLQPVFRNGHLVKKWDFSELIANSEREVPEHYYSSAIAEMAAARAPRPAMVGA
jgi:nicotinamide phosphoribosyltransferase